MITRNHIRPPIEFTHEVQGDTDMAIIAIICLGLLMGVAATEANAA
jgi:hypothetical protein